MFTYEQLHNANGVPYSNGLFYQTTIDKSTAIFTLGKEHKDGYLSLRKLFIELTVDDPSEAVFAETVFGDVGYWLRLQESGALKDVIGEWREVAEVKRKSKAFTAIVNEIKNETRNSYQAAKYLIEEPWKPSDRKTRAATKKTTSDAFSSVQEDIKRLGDFLQ